jgi:penicillin amidase
VALGHRTLPLTDAPLPIRTAALLRGPLTIRRDAHSIPYIEAENDEDAWFGLGFCQGQDRAFQLELRLRMVRGTLSALIGEQGLAFDRLSRRVGLHYTAGLQLPAFDADVRTTIEAFVRGINAGIEAGGGARAHEFTILRTRPTRWQAEDVVAAGKLMSMLLIGNWDVELARLKILSLDGEQALRDLDPSYPEHHVVTSPPGTMAGSAIDRLSDDLAAAREFGGGLAGSNNWAIAGSRTATGRPLLANDPHLDPTLPPHWYLAHVRTPEWMVAGASLIASPGIGAGHNGTCAWGVTAALTDTVDLFVEEVGPDGCSVRQGDAFVPCEVRREVIEIKGAPDVVEDVLMTPRGPIIGPALQGEVGALSMSAVWQQPLPARGFFTLNRTRSFEDVRREFAKWPVLPLNIAFADISGAIGWQMVGQAPRRRKGWGTLPLPGADPEAGWRDDHVPFDEMPHLLDPEAGFIASANNKPLRDGPFSVPTGWTAFASAASCRSWRTATAGRSRTARGCKWTRRP